MWTKLKIVDGKEVFEFPKNGILIFSDKFNGSINHQYYYVDGKGIKIEIPQADIDKENIAFPYIPILGAGTMNNREIKFGDTNNYEKENVKFSDFSVNQKETKDFDYKDQQKFDSITFTIVGRKK